MQERNKIRIETIRKDKSILKITSRSTVESHDGELKIDIQVSELTEISIGKYVRSSHNM